MSKVTYYRTPADDKAERLVSRIAGDGVCKRNVSALAREIGEPRETVSGWLRHPERMPLHGYLALAEAVGLSVEVIQKEVRV